VRPPAAHGLLMHRRDTYLTKDVLFWDMPIRSFRRRSYGLSVKSDIG